MKEHPVDDYDIVRELGQGGFGAVFEATSPDGDRVAIKILHEHLVSDSTVVQRFFQEAQIMSRLEHPAIPKVYHFGPYQNTHYLVQEFVEGRELEEVIGNSPMTPPEAVAVMEQLLDALGYAHKEGIVHRDLKPANLILKSTGQLKILDFGIAKIIGGVQLTAPGIVNVTLGYASPEQLMGTTIDGRADLFAAGILFHQLLTGAIPCKPVGKDPLKAYQTQIEWTRSPRRTLTADHPHLPTWVDAFYTRCTAPQATDRYLDAQAARDALLASAKPADLRPRINRGPKRALTAEDIDDAPATTMMDIEDDAMDSTIQMSPGHVPFDATAQLTISPDAATATLDATEAPTIALDTHAAAPTAPEPPPRSQKKLAIAATTLFLMVIAAIVVALYLFDNPQPSTTPDPATPAATTDAGDAPQ